MPSAFFISRSRKKREELSICLLGKEASHGNVNGIENFVLQNSKIELKRKLRLTFVGLNDQKSEIKIRESLGLDSQIEFSLIEHIPHDIVTYDFASYQVGSIPYPDSAYHQERFLIKIL